MDTGLDSETAVVLASSSGLGKASAESLAAAGANVVLCGRDPDRLDAGVADVRDVAAGGVRGVQADVTDRDDVATVVEAAVEEFGGVDHLVTSAGGPPPGSVLDADPEDWQEAYDLLVMSVVYALHECHDHLVESDAGTVTAITSTSVKEPINGIALSNSVRRGVVGTIKTISREWAPDVRANVVMPGPHETGRLADIIEADVEAGRYEDYEAGLADKAASVPLDRVGDPRELGDVVAFLASERASFVTGTAIPVDGGRTRS
ncbi:MAG: SDR family oxidoreductase [Halobacteriaceae archaeon]